MIQNNKNGEISMSILRKIHRPIIASALIVSSLLLFGNSAMAEEVVPVNVENFVRAETASQIGRGLTMTGGINKWYHFSKPVPIDKQNVIRMNLDTLYSNAIVDISKGATLTIPDSGERYMSVMALNEDHYINKVFHKGGTYKLTMEEFHTPYLILAARTLANANDPEDIKKANALQNQLKVEAKSSKPYTHPNFDKKSYKATLDALLELSKGVSDTKNMFGKKEDVTQVRHLLGAAYGYAGLPEHEAFYITKNEPRKAGDFQLTVKNVPVDGFWSLSVYNKDGFFEENKFKAYSTNKLIAKPNKDGSITVNFGTDPEGKENFIYVMDGWNYTVRLYLPRKEILNGKWSFPEPQPVK